MYFVSQTSMSTADITAMDSPAPHVLTAADLDAIPGMSDGDRLRLQVLLLQHPDGVDVRMHRFELQPSKRIKSTADVLRLADGQRTFVVEQLVSIVRTSVPDISP